MTIKIEQGSSTRDVLQLLKEAGNPRTRACVLQWIKSGALKGRLTDPRVGYILEDQVFTVPKLSAKRKYTGIGEVAVRYECTKKKCKWQGYDNEKSTKRLGDGWIEVICPKCGNNEFYGLLK